MDHVSIRNLPESFSPATLASALSISKSSGYRWCKKVGIATRIGGRIVIFKEDLLEKLSESKVTTDSGSYVRHSKAIMPINRITETYDAKQAKQQKYYRRNVR